MLPEIKSDRVTAWSLRHRALAVGLWFAFVAAAVLAGSQFSGGARAEDPGDTGRAQRVLDAQEDRGAYDPARESVLTEPAAAAGPLAEALRARPDLVAEVRSPLDADGADLRSGPAGLVTFAIAGPPEGVRDAFTAVSALIAEHAAAHPEARYDQTGDLSLSTVVDQAIKEDVQRAEFISLPLTLVVLVIVFGALVAAAIPLLLAASVVAAGFGVLAVLDDAVPMNSATSVMIMLVGMAVGVDYALFYLRRVREERAAGRPTAEAVRTAAATSGRVVTVSGITVVLCLAGLPLTGLDNFTGLALGTAVVVGLALAGSVTVLPAALSLLGERVDLGRVPFLGRTRESRLWGGIARSVTRRPLLWGALAVLALLLMALPALTMRLQSPAPTESLTPDVPAVAAALRVQEAFPGAASPARVVLWGPGLAEVDPAVAELRGRVTGPVAAARVGDALVLRVPLPGAGGDEESVAALERLRSRVLPETVGRVDGVDFAVAGRTAFAHDFAARLTARTPLVFAFVLVTAFVVLAVAFRSVVVSLISIALNLLSIGASYGVLTWAFQGGALESLLGFRAYGGVVDWLPLFMFVLLFGLSMDYHIFVLSRVRERRRAGLAMPEAVTGGVAASAGVVTGAAAIMVAVFCVFASLSAVEYKMLGVGMAVAIALDATLVRGILLPVALSLRFARRSLSV
ncbi:exporter [Actinorhabdospora filicis]|uniref:Exporter n=1 Tax=Actinorhabdospora filicis TaxID=1785913 RepID=A0A9W6SPS2_9ACTN|nr:MMPL family transporter [Actinorhabdospora filicis]GLZ79779.1 exporter [Actinorhabdospora filicis]